MTPHFSAHVYYGKTAGWITMPLSTEVGLSPGDVVLDGVQAPPKRAQPPVFGPCLLWPNGWMDEDATWYGNRPRPRPQCVTRGPSSPPPRNGHSSPPFRQCLLWPRSPISATAELLLRYPVAYIQYKMKLDNNEDHTFSFFSFSRMTSLQIISE